MQKFLMLSVLSIFGIGAFSYYNNQQAPNREIASRLALPTSTIPKLSNLQEAQKYIQLNNLDQIEYTGALITEDIDLFQGPVHIQRFFIDDGRERIQIDPVNKEALANLSGEQVNLVGWRSQKSGRPVGLVAPLSQTKMSNAAQKLREENMLIVMAEFNDSTPLPTGANAVSWTNIKDFLNSRVFQDYFNFTYQGRLKNTVTKVVTYKFDRNCADKNLGIAGTAGHIDQTDINEVFGAHLLNPRAFQNVSVLANCNAGVAWGVGTSAYVGGQYLTVSNLTMWPSYFIYGESTEPVPYMPVPPKWSFIDGFIHERLHTLGHPHANGLDCGTNAMLSPCTHIEYGNPFDVMGARNPGFMLNAHHLKRVNARPESQFLTIIRPGTYTVDSLSSRDKKAIIAAYIKIPEVTSRVFMLERRTPEMFDRNLDDPRYNMIKKGLLIYSSMTPWANYGSFSEYDFRLFDPYPKETKYPLASFYERIKNKALVPQKPFFDPITGVRITVLDTKSEKTSFKVEFNNRERICFKAGLTQIIEPFRFIKNDYEVFAPDEIATFRPGDTFNIQAITHQAQESVCPRLFADTVISETSLITMWRIGKFDTGELPPIEEIAVSKKKPWPPEGGGDGESLPFIETSFANFDSISTVTNKMRVPVGAAVGYYELPVTYKLQGSTQEFTSTLKFQIEPLGPKKPIVKPTAQSPFPTYFLDAR